MEVGIRVPLVYLEPGMMVAEDVFQGKNLLLPKGTILKEHYLKRLRSRGISEICVFVDKYIVDQMMINPIEKFYARTYMKISQFLDTAKKGEQIGNQHFFPIVESILDTIFLNEGPMLLLTGFRTKTDYYYAHSLDVCIFCLITAKALAFSPTDMVALGIAALLHDVGKVRIPEKILFKESSLTDFEFDIMKRHSGYGYEIVMQEGLAPGIANAVLQHHERIDGSGYPSGLKDNEISQHAQIIALADIYDAMTSDKVYQNKVLPHQAAAELQMMCSRGVLDKQICETFIRNVCVYPRGCQVVLNTNEVGVVIDPRPDNPSRPIIKIYTDINGHALRIPQMLDLQQNTRMQIKQAFN